MQTRIATCCYCGTRAALVLEGAVQHELACASCGAPLSQMKNLKTGADKPRKTKASKSKAAKSAKRPKSPADEILRALAGRTNKKSRKKKSKKGLAHRFFDEAFDVIEDIFD